MCCEWVKVRVELLGQEALKVAAAALKMAQPEYLIGYLVRFWSWAESVGDRGKLNGVTFAAVDSAVGVDGFANAMQSVGWLTVTTEGVRVEDWQKHNGPDARRRALTAKRVAEYRKRKRAKSIDVCKSDELENVDEPRAHAHEHASAHAGAHAGAVSRTSSLFPDLEEEKESLTPRCDKSQRPPLPLRKPKRSANGPKAKAQAEDVLKEYPTLDNPEFRKLWDEYKRHREKIKRPLGGFAESLALSQLLKVSYPQAVAATERSIVMGWIGIFPGKEAAETARQGPPTAEEREKARQRSREECRAYFEARKKGRADGK